jgi:hypothetical protein
MQKPQRGQEVKEEKKMKGGASTGLGVRLKTGSDDLNQEASDLRLPRAAPAEGLGTFDPEIQDQAALALLVGP